MVKSKIISLAAAVLMAIMIIMPLLSQNAHASSLSEAFAGTKTRTSIYSAALLDADLLYSEDGCLTDSEESRLLDLMVETADKIKCNVGIAIISDLKGMTPERFNTNFSHTMFGSTSDSVTFLFLNRHGNSTYISRGYTDDMYFKNRGEELFNKKANRIFDRVYDALGSDSSDYSHLYSGCTSFCAALTQYGTGFGAFLTKFNISGTTLMVMFVFGMVVSIIVVTSIQRGYKKKTPISASHYIDKGRTRINRQVDQFVREYTTSVKIESSSGGHHGGGGSHRSGGSHHSGRGR